MTPTTTTTKKKNSKYRNTIARMLTKDPKKAAVLSVLVVVMIVMWAKVMIKGKTGPAKATAATGEKGGSSSDKSRNALDAADSVDDQVKVQAALYEWLSQGKPAVSRNLFAVKFDYFQQDAARSGQTLRPPNGDGFWDKLAKSMTDQAEEKKEQEILVENLRLQAAQLKLQTIMMGATPKALISGGGGGPNGDRAILVGEGDVVAKFRVLKIEARRVIVEQKGIQLAILMK